MMSPLGSSFAPTSAADEERKKPNPAQSAIQVLSMRLPRVRGARSISPLVGEPGSAARREKGGFSADSAVLQTLMRAMSPSGAGMSAPDGSMPWAGAGGGGSDPMSAAMAALGGGMMNAPASAPQAPVIVPGIADPNRPIPPLVPVPPSAPEPEPRPGPEPPSFDPAAVGDPTVPGRGPMRRKPWM